jgi:hypothetical protein
VIHWTYCRNPILSFLKLLMSHFGFLDEGEVLFPASESQVLALWFHGWDQSCSNLQPMRIFFCWNCSTESTMVFHPNNFCKMCRSSELRSLSVSTSVLLSIWIIIFLSYSTTRLKTILKSTLNNCILPNLFVVLHILSIGNSFLPVECCSRCEIISWHFVRQQTRNVLRFWHMSVKWWGWSRILDPICSHAGNGVRVNNSSPSKGYRSQARRPGHRVVIFCADMLIDCLEPSSLSRQSFPVRLFWITLLF